MLRLRTVYLVFLFFAALVFFGKSLTVFFAQDDFWLLSISKVTNIGDLLNFFIPLKGVVWYRPLSSQFFFYIFGLFFGMNPWGYHLIVISTHVFVSFLIFKLISQVSKNVQTGFLAAYLYVIHQVHTVSVSWLAAYSFIISPLFLVLMLLYYVKNKYGYAFIFFILALLSHEIAIVGIGFLWLYQKIILQKNNASHLISYLIFGICILFLRFKLFPAEISTEAYSLSIGKEIFATCKFYLLRIIGVPWFFDGMPIIFRVITLIFVGIFITYLIWGILEVIQIKFKRRLIFWLGMGGLGLTPFLLYPNHLASHYLSFALLGGAPLFAELVIIRINKLHSRLRLPVLIGFLFIFTFLQYVGSQWAYRSYWIFKRAELAKELISKNDLLHEIGTEAYFSLGAGSAEKIYK